PVWLLAVVVTFGFPTVFAGGTCHWTSSDDCDDDDFDDDDWDDCDWDDDDNDRPGAALNQEETRDPYRLVEFEQVTSHEPGAHPVAWLRHIQGISLFYPEGPVSYEEADFEMFTSLLIVVNKDLLGLPPGAGVLTFDGVEFREGHTGASGFEVRWRQETQQPDGSWQPVPDAALVFYFDAVGNLVTIRNHTSLQPGQR
ncbi:MAG: hypothetical protein ACYST0_13420, partial [Planctomycetota bacterium]